MQISFHEDTEEESKAPASLNLHNQWHNESRFETEGNLILIAEGLGVTGGKTEMPEAGAGLI